MSRFRGKNALCTFSAILLMVPPVVRNAGNVPLFDLVALDDKGESPSRQSGDVNGNAVLDVGEVWTYAGTGRAMEGQYKNIARETARDPNGKKVTDEDPSHYLGIPPPVEPSDDEEEPEPQDKDQKRSTRDCGRCSSKESKNAEDGTESRQSEGGGTDSEGRSPNPASGTSMRSCLRRVTTRAQNDMHNMHGGSGKRTQRQTTHRAPLRTENELHINTYPTDGGRLLDLEQPIYLDFTQEVSARDFSFRIQPDPGGWSVDWLREGRSARLKHRNPFTKGTEYRLEVTLDSLDRTDVVTFTAYGPSSLQLIGAAEKAGDLDVDTAWKFRFQAIFEPDHLPSKYQSATPFRSGTGMLDDFHRARKALKPGTIKKLTPYLVRPTDPRSYLNRPRNGHAGTQPSPFYFVSTGPLLQSQRPPEERPELEWTPYESNVYPIKVWSATGAQSALRVLDCIHAHQMYSCFRNLLGREPVSDIQVPNNGGDGKLDIYVVPGPYETAICQVEAMSNGRQQPCWIGIHERLRGDTLTHRLAHELFHAFQNAFDCNEQKWWKEATAKWAENYVSPGTNLERSNLMAVFDRTTHWQKPLTLVDGTHEYGIYLFPLYLSQKFGDKKIGEIWQACEDVDALTAIDGAVRGGGNAMDDGLDGCFKEFSLWNSDLGPYQSIYEDAPPPIILHHYHGERDIRLASDRPLTSEVVSLPSLSARFYRFHNEVNAKATPHIRFDLGDFVKNKKYSVQAIIDPEGRATEEDWSDRADRCFCINDEEENFDSIALVIASSKRNGPASATDFPALVVEVNCDKCFEGETRVRITRTRSYAFSEDTSDASANKTAYSRTNRQIQATVDAVFKYKESVYTTDPPELTEYYELKSWQISSFKARENRYRYYEIRDECCHRGIQSKTVGTVSFTGVKPRKHESEDCELGIDIDPETGRARRICLYSGFELLYDWQGKAVEKTTAGTKDWDCKEGKYHGSSTWSGKEEWTYPDNSFVVDAWWPEAEKVTSGDGIRHLKGGGATVVDQHVQGTTQERTSWQVWRRKSNKSEK